MYQGEQYYKGSLRLPEYDYSQNGAYFVTLVAYKRQHLFGKMIQGEMKLSEIGKLIYGTWQEIPTHFYNVTNDYFIVMPNHMHGIVIIDYDPPTIVDATHASHLQQGERKEQRLHQCKGGRLKNDSLVESSEKQYPKGPAPGSLGAIIGSFKSAASKRIHEIDGYQGCKIWQRNYYEHVIRDEEELQRMADYIESNPMNWVDDAI